MNEIRAAYSQLETLAVVRHTELISIDEATDEGRKNIDDLGGESRTSRL